MKIKVTNHPFEIQPLPALIVRLFISHLYGPWWMRVVTPVAEKELLFNTVNFQTGTGKWPSLACLSYFSTKADFSHPKGWVCLFFNEYQILQDEVNL